ncbi:PadR family transcriptional regulator [Saccharomonospora sp. NB11]|uniref:PadR family transcriptional regulator n=1 Tax=Saccharomonospora sp. NB11 TaxID=1642298 RepID=UPI0027DE7772|nr:PadR family transcriptional regulator [Saccharomonospora sp. NB11]
MQHDRRAQWLRAVLEPCVLALVRRRESYGYELAAALEEAGLGPVKGGTLYPLLLRLERRELITATWREGTVGPARKYYRITPAGEEALRDTAAEWHAFRHGVDSILGKGR